MITHIYPITKEILSNGQDLSPLIVRLVLAYRPIIPR